MQTIDGGKVSLTRRDFLKLGSLSLAALTSGACVPLPKTAGTAGPGSSETSAGWMKSEFNPVLGGSLGTCFDASVLKDGGLYRMWFSWRPKQSIALVESQDGIHWSTPSVVLTPAPGSLEKNVNRPVVAKISGSYHMWYTVQTTQRSWIDYATSPDGIAWDRGNGNPVLSAEKAWEGPAVMSPHVIYDDAARLFRMWYSGGDQYEPLAIGYATSPDGIQWTKYPDNPVFTPDPAQTWEQERVAACQVIPYDGWYMMFYIGFRDVDHAQIGLARSKDGISGWIRHAQNPIIRPGVGTWDGDAVYKPAALVEANRWLLWYNGRRSNVEQIGLALHPGLDLGF